MILGVWFDQVLQRPLLLQGLFLLCRMGAVKANALLSTCLLVVLVAAFHGTAF